MAAVTLKSLLRPASTSGPCHRCAVEGQRTRASCIFDAQDKPLMGDAPERRVAPPTRASPVDFEGRALGYVVGPAELRKRRRPCCSRTSRRANQRAARSRRKSFTFIAKCISSSNSQSSWWRSSTRSAVAESALAQAQRLISATHGSVLVIEEQDGILEPAASFGGLRRRARSAWARIALCRIHPRARHGRDRQ